MADRTSEQTSKVLNYVDAWITSPYFVMFMSVWSYMRHYLNLVILWSMRPGGEFATIGPYELDFSIQQYKCWISQAITFSLLACLQAVNIFWFVLIIRILVRLLWSGVRKDDRSDEEDEDELEEVHGPMTNGNTTKPRLTAIDEHTKSAETLVTARETLNGSITVKRKR